VRKAVSSTAVQPVEEHEQPLTALCQEGVRALNAALKLPPAEIKTEVDDAERATIHFRDRLIERLRGDHTRDQERRWHTALDRANAAVSLLAAQEYSAAGVQREVLKQARSVLQGLARRKL
jgi:hypothetical protein